MGGGAVRNMVPTWLQDLKEWTKLNIAGTSQLATDGERWRKIIKVTAAQIEEEERLLWQNKCALYTIIIQSIDMIGLATETPIKTCNMSLAWEPPYNDIIIHINKIYMFTYNNIQ